MSNYSTFRTTQHASCIRFQRRIRQGARADTTFTKAGLMADILMSALDADVIKTYVELGIIASIAYKPTKENGLRLLDCSELFETNTTLIAVRKGHYLRGYGYRFMELCVPALTEARVRGAIAPSREETLD